MSTFFKKEALEAKLDKLTDTQESVTVLSQYFVFHRNQAQEAVDTWFESLSKGASTYSNCSIYPKEIGVSAFSKRYSSAHKEKRRGICECIR